MQRWSVWAVVLAACIMAAYPAMGALNTIPQSGTVFIGEQGLDITATGATTGSQIAWFGPNGQVSDVPSATVTIADAQDFYASSAMFSSKTGPWFNLPAKTLAFYIQDPTLDLKVEDTTLDFTISPSVNWIPLGDTVGFRIDTNMYVMSNRPGVSGAPVTIKVMGPGGIEYSSFGSYSLKNIPVDTTPFRTGGIWFTGSSDYARGTYQVWAECNANDMKDNYERVGKTVSEDQTFVVQSVNPLITTKTTTPSTTAVTIPVTTTAVTVTRTTAVPTATKTQPVEPTLTDTGAPATPVPTTLTPTASPGFEGVITIIAAACMVFMVRSGRR